MMVPDRPDSGYMCLLTTAVVRGMAKIPRSEFSPIRFDAAPGSRLKEDVLLVVLANDAGWNIVEERACAIPGFCPVPVVPGSTDTAVQRDTASNRLSQGGVRFHVHKRFNAACRPQHVVLPTQRRAADSHTRIQHGLRHDLVALQQAYPRQCLALGAAQQIYTDGSAQASGHDGGARVGAGVYDARSGREITIDPCGIGPTQTVHRAELVAIQTALQYCAGNEDVRILTDSHASMDGIRYYMQKPSHMQMHTYRDLLRDIVARLAARGRNNLRTTIAKVAAHTGIEGDERADAIAKRAAAPNAVTDCSQSLGNRPFDNPILAAHL